MLLQVRRHSLNLLADRFSPKREEASLKSRLQKVIRDDISYNVLVFVCPGCVAGERPGYEGVHMLPVNVPEGVHKPSWDWDGNLEAPTLSPSILTTGPSRCHSFLNAGIFDFLSDSEHSLAGQKVPMPDLPEWAETIS